MHVLDVKWSHNGLMSNQHTNGTSTVSFDGKRCALLPMFVGLFPSVVLHFLLVISKESSERLLLSVSNAGVFAGMVGHYAKLMRASRVGSLGAVSSRLVSPPSSISVGVESAWDRLPALCPG